jgi:predicted RNase H-like HicB family nuclease
MQVIALIHEGNGRFGVSFPDFPGCTTVAESADAAVARAAEVLAFHVEGLAEDGPLPEVHTLSQLTAEPTFRNDSKGAMIALVPYAPPSRAVRLNITLDESLLGRVDRAAAAAGETRSGYLAQAALQRLSAATGQETVSAALRGFAERPPAGWQGTGERTAPDKSKRSRKRSSADRRPR